MPKLVTEFQKKLNEGAVRIDDLINSMEDNAYDIKNDIEMGIEELEEMDREKDPRLKHVVPGERVNRALNEIYDLERYDNQDIDNYGEELALSLKEFEKLLQKELDAEKLRVAEEVHHIKLKIEK